MPLMEWFTKYSNPFSKLFHTQTMDASTISPTSTQTVPTLSFDLEAPTDPSAGWKVTNVQGAGDGSNDFANKLQDLLRRTEAYSILNNLFYRHVVAVLVVAWSVVLWRKHRSADTMLSWRDGLAGAMFVASVFWKDMVIAIGLTAAYAAWSTLAERPWNATGKLPGFEAFIASLKPAGEDNADESVNTDPIAPAEPDPEAARLARIEANLGLPEKKPSEECVVCWSSSDEEETPLKLPCSHLVCEACLVRLKEANRFLCPFCRRPLYSLDNNKVYLFQACVAASGAQLALALVLAALRFARRQYWGVALCLFFKAYPAAAALMNSWGIRRQGEEGYFASTSETGLKVELAFSLWLLKSTYGSMDEVGWATFVDGKFVRARRDEWQDLRNFVCWAVPGVAGKVLDCWVFGQG